jgi:hypothetical protein
MTDMRKLLEAVDKFAGGLDQKQGPAGQLKGRDPMPHPGAKQHPAYHKLVGASESKNSNKLNFLKELDKSVDKNSLEWKLAEEYANFNEDNLGVEPKRPHRKGSRAEEFGPRGHKEHPRYKTIKEAAVGDGDVANAVVDEVIKLIGEGHTEVSPDVITTKVSAALGRPFMLKDLVAANNSSPELQHYIDSINPSKIKFSTDILTVKNQDPAKEKEKAQSGVSSMAARAANRPRLGEGLDEGGYQDDTREREEYLRYERSRNPVADEIRKRLNPNQKSKKSSKPLREFGATSTGSSTSAPIAGKPVSSAGAVGDPEQLKKVAAATATIKSATGSPTAPDKLAQTLSKASSGQALSTQDMQTLEPMMGIVGKTAQDPNLANQFKSLANLAKNIK